jgi:hypothetical protein
MNLVRRLKVLHSVPPWKLTVYFIELVLSCNCFKFEETFVLAHNAVLGYVAEKHVTAILKPTLSRDGMSCKMFPSGN